ncbi:PTS transporter subunit IIC [Enterococcus cecorum]
MFLHCIHCTGKETVESISGGVNWLVYPLFQGLSFSVALYVIITGVRLFLGEIVGAFVGISEKLIPNAKPRVRLSSCFPICTNSYSHWFLSRICSVVCLQWLSWD